jgi:polyisoprenoid-binding protein YceI
VVLRASALLLLGTGAALLLSACGAGAAAGSGTRASSPVRAASGAGAPVSGTFRIAPGSTASYTAHETFLRQNLPHAPVGTTSGVTGQVVLVSGVIRDGTVRVDLTGLHTHTAMRDRRVQQALDTAAHPEATFVITGEASGSPLVRAGPAVDVKVEGNLTLHGVTRPEAWDAQVSVRGAALHAVATLDVDMTAFGVQPPDIAGFVSVEPGIQLGADIAANRG